MRFLQINTYYPAYLQDFYAARPQLLSANYETQIDALLDDGFSDSHIFSRTLKEHGFETFQVAINNPASQNAWLASQGLPLRPDNEHAVTALQQIEHFAPDIVYTTDVVTLRSSLLHQLKTRPRLIAGWRGYPLPENADLSAYDLILTSFDRIFEEAKARGAKSVERFHPGFPESISVLDVPRSSQWDVTFSGSVTPEHSRRIGLINLLAEISGDPNSPFSFGIFMPDANALSPLVQSLNQPALWAHDMLRLLRASKIVVNIDVDAFGSQPPNMRLIEATGAGAFLLTPFHPELKNFFEPGEEVETFRNENELISKIQYYLADSSARERIARRGQERCLRDHNHKARTAWIADIFRNAVATS
jgi:hypothetical protein